MGGEDAFLPDLGYVGFIDRPGGAAAQLLLKQGEGQQGRVAFIHVVNIHAMAEGAGHARSAHAEDNLLLQAIVSIAAVEVVGEAAVPTGVSVDVGIEQINGHDVAVASDEIIAPGADGNDSILNADRDAHRFLGAEIGRIPRLDIFALGTFGVAVLPEIALAVQ